MSSRSALLALLCVSVAALAACTSEPGDLAEPTPSGVARAAEPAPTRADATPSPAPSPEPTAPSVEDVLAALAPSLGPSVAVDTYVPDPAHARDSYPVHYDQKCHQDIDGDSPWRCTFGDEDSATQILLVGDSHAAHWSSGLAQAATDEGWQLQVSSKTACPVLDQLVWIRARDGAYESCLAWGEAVVERILADPPDLVVTSLSGEYDVVTDGVKVPAGDEADAALRSALERTWGRLRDAGVPLVVIQDTPWLAQELGDCLEDHLTDPAACDSPADEALAASGQANIAAAAQETGTPVIDLTPWLCTDEICPAVVDGMLVMRDEHHVTAEYSRSLAPVLGAAIEAVLAADLG